MSVNYKSIEKVSCSLNTAKVNKSVKKQLTYDGILPTEENKVFLSNISHNIKNPFGALLGYSNLFIEDYSELNDAERILYANEINSTAELTFRYLERFLEWIYYKTGKVQLDIKENNLREIVTTSINDVLSKTNFLCDISIKIDSSISVYVDRESISKMLFYVLENALKYSQPNSIISISAIELDDQISLTIEDNGDGIPEEIKNKLFNISEKIPYSGKFEPGCGLGLILTKEIINLNNSSISINSNENGTKVIIKLPNSLFN
jgi:K+-sensing histidine kinase KdpD